LLGRAARRTDLIRALYTAASGMMIEARKLDTVSKNLFYVQTPGFKATRELRAARGPTTAELPSDVQVRLEAEFVDGTPGQFRMTGKELDLAIEGDGFFTVETPGGTAYTRDGRFRRSADGVVRDGSGNALLGEGGPIRFPAGATIDARVEVTETGMFRVDGADVDRIALADFPGYRGLKQAGGSYFFATGTDEPRPSSAHVVQRTLEDANVSGVAEMTRTVETLRAFESYQKIIQSVMDETTGEAVRRIGRVA
jgi:flagellar basal-body rod protein FlgG